MKGNKGRSPAGQNAFVRAGAWAGVLLYGLLCLHPSNLKPVFLFLSQKAFAASEASVASSASPTAPTVSQENAIAVPEGMAAEAGAHTCCCKHAPGEKCAMGCCGAKPDILAGETCYRECPGSGPTAYQDLSRLDNHLAPALPRFIPHPAFTCLSPSPVRMPLSLPPRPVEKIPIV